MADRRRHPVLAAHVFRRVHGSGWMGRINTAVALAITRRVGSMYCAYLFTAIGVTGVVAALTANLTLTLVVGAISGYLLQLVLLPIILVAQNVQSAHADAVSAQTYADAEAILAAIRELSGKPRSVPRS